MYEEIYIVVSIFSGEDNMKKSLCCNRGISNFAPRTVFFFHNSVEVYAASSLHLHIFLSFLPTYTLPTHLWPHPFYSQQSKHISLSLSLTLFSFRLSSISYWVQPVLPVRTWVHGYLLKRGEVIKDIGLKTLALQDAISFHSFNAVLMQNSKRHDCNVLYAMMQGHRLLLPSDVTNP